MEPQRASSELGLPNRQHRRSVEIRAYLVRADGEIVDLRVLDLSYDGCGVETVVPLRPEEKIKLSVLGRGAATATVRWCKGRKAGLRFESDEAERRQPSAREERSLVAGEVVLRRSGSPNYRVKVVDVTRFGCRCEFVERPRIEERVWVKFDGLEALEAEVCWVESYSAGLKYANPLHPAVFDMLHVRLEGHQ